MRLPPCSTLSPYTTLFRSALVEELGDLLLQVLFHARVGTEGSIGAPFDIDDVAIGLIAKLVRRHPHVFSGGDASTPEQVNQRWEEIKATEKPRSSVLDRKSVVEGKREHTGGRCMMM